MSSPGPMMAVVGLMNSMGILGTPLSPTVSMMCSM
jgi:hypothetical protein